MADLRILKAWKKNIASTINPGFSIMSTTQHMRNFEDQMWIKKTKIQMKYNDYKNSLCKYIRRSALFNPILGTEITINQVILNKVKKV